MKILTSPDQSPAGITSSPYASIERERRALRAIALGQPLNAVLDELLKTVEEQSDQHMLTSILIVTEDGKHLKHGAGPSLPADYNAAIDGIPLDEGVGSCGTGAKRGEPVYVADIANDPLWKDYRELALAHNLRACWSSPIKDVDGKVLGTFAIYYDAPRSPNADDLNAIAQITQTVSLALERYQLDQKQRQTENELRFWNSSLESQVEARVRDRDRSWKHSPDLLAVVTSQGEIENINPAWEATLGWTEAELRGRRISELFDDGDKDAFDAVMRKVNHAIPIFRFENRIRLKDNSYRSVSWSAVPEGANVYFSGRDIQPDKDAAEALAKAEEALRLTQKMEAVGQLSGGLAHDFNNLLAGVSGSLELIHRRIQQGRHADLERYIGVAQGAARRAAALTQRLLAFSRRQTLAPKPINLNMLTTDMEEMLSRTIGPSVELEIIGGVGLWGALADQSQVENALLNLCINARDAMPDGGRITIETKNRTIEEREAMGMGLSKGQYVQFSVRDNGSGMPPEVAARAFDPFFTTKPIGMGTGLGLSMVYGFAQQSGGQAVIHSKVGEGTVVCVWLPRQDLPQEASGVPEMAPAPEPAADGQTVLVVDDEPSVRMLMTDVLEEEGYTVLIAGDGQEALKILRSARRIDALVTDVGLPGGLNGRQVADAARIHRPSLEILFVTGYAESAVLNHDSLESGMQVLTKPFDLDTLLHRVKGMVETA
ncbi:ATP-binding protein [Xylophilus sp. GOD-11R]|uniref:ATP-binding protein n=1 Tax=Xylophilus sp. GOD-11R TaxID=3089814 RepID=UPI00298D2734|nr:ATP-binding protein [Xylophilus sp. GOD-11R]WPB58264.1 response regulator [Xylophilus sp. GOD-11R]